MQPRKLWPAATVKVGNEELEGRIVGVFDYAGVFTRKLIANADSIRPLAGMAGQYQLLRDGDVLGVVSDADLANNADLVARHVREEREARAGEIVWQENESERYTLREVLVMLLGAVILGFLACWIGR